MVFSGVFNDIRGLNPPPPPLKIYKKKKRESDLLLMLIPVAKSKTVLLLLVSQCHFDILLCSLFGSAAKFFKTLLKDLV